MSVIEPLTYRRVFLLHYRQREKMALMQRWWWQAGLTDGCRDLGALIIIVMEIVHKVKIKAKTKIWKLHHDVLKRIIISMSLQWPWMTLNAETLLLQIDIFNIVILPWFMLLFNSKALLSQWKPRDATVNFDTYRNLQQLRAVFPAAARLLFTCVS